jgi:hypothetical protein
MQQTRLCLTKDSSVYCKSGELNKIMAQVQESIAGGFTDFRRARGSALRGVCADLLEIGDGIPGITVLEPYGDREPRVRLLGDKQINTDPSLLHGLSRLTVYSALESLPFFNDRHEVTAVASDYRDARQEGADGAVYIEFDEKSGAKLKEEKLKKCEALAELAGVPVSALGVEFYTPNMAVVFLSPEMCGLESEFREAIDEKLPFGVILRHTKILPKLDLAPYDELIKAAADKSVLNNRAIQEAIDEWGIHPKDTDVIAKLAAVGINELVIGWHNFFSHHLSMEDPQESTVAAIHSQTERHKAELTEAQSQGDEFIVRICEGRLVLDQGMLYLTQAYGPSEAYAIARALE